MSDQPEWLKGYVMGLENPGKWSIIIESETHAIIRRGGYYWSGRMLLHSSQRLVTKGINYWDEQRRTVWHGRITNARKAEMETALAAAVD